MTEESNDATQQPKPHVPAGASANPLSYEAVQDTVARNRPAISRSTEAVIYGGAAAVTLLLLMSAGFFLRIPDAGPRKAMYCLVGCGDVVAAAVICAMTIRYVRRARLARTGRWRWLGLVLIGLGVLWLLQGACFVAQR